MIIASIPDKLSNFASSLIASAQLFNPIAELDPDVIIRQISDEYERRKAKKPSASRSSGSKSAKKDNDEAMMVSPGKRKTGWKPRGACWNCGEKGHLRDKCLHPLKSSKSKSNGGDARGSARASRTANTAVDCDSESDGGWAIYCDSDDEDDDDAASCMPALLTESESDSGGEGNGDTYFSDSEVEEVDWVSWECERVPKDVAVDGASLVSPQTAALLSDTERVPVHGTEDPENAASAITVEDDVDLPRKELYDSGATRHISPYRSDFERFETIPPKPFKAANKQTFDALGTGDIVVEVLNGAHISQLRLTEVLYSPEVGYTLISIGRLDKLSFSTTFAGGTCIIHAPSGKHIGVVPCTKHGLYRVVHDSSAQDKAGAAEELTVMEFHHRMGHVAPSMAKRLVEKGFVMGIKLVDSALGDPLFCESCVFAKAHRKPVPKMHEGEWATTFGGEVHSDLWGPARITTLSEHRYYVSFTDDKTRVTHLYLLRMKSETFPAYKKFEALCKTQHNAAVQILHSDHGGEYTGINFVTHLERAGTKQKLTVHDTPQQNGVAEHLNRTLMEKVRAMLHASQLPHFLWGEAIRHAVWLKNCTDTKAIDGMTPFEVLTGRKPNLSGVREWGSRVWMHNMSGLKLDPRAREGRWVGIDEVVKGCRVYWPRSKTVTVERNVYYAPPRKRRIRHLLRLPFCPPPAPTPAPDPIPESTRPQRIHKPSTYVHALQAGEGVAFAHASNPVIPLSIQVPGGWDIGEGEPGKAEGAEGRDEGGVLGEDSGDERAEVEDTLGASDEDEGSVEYALAAEMDEAEGLKLRSLAEVKRSKWVFKAKKDTSSNVVRYKARLVTQEFSQIPGVDYFDTYMPVAKLASVCTVLVIANRNDMELHQVDIKGAYLNGDLTPAEVIYMRHPPGYAPTGSAGKVLRLKRMLYGLKQFGQRWYQKLTSIFVDSMGFVRCQVDQAVFHKHQDAELTIVVIHVDDCTITVTMISLIDDFKARLRKHVEVTDLGELHWLLGIEIKRDRDAGTIHLCQRSYINSILCRFNFDELKPVSTPMEPQNRLSTAQSPSTTSEIATMHDVPYREAVSAVQWTSLTTCPDISFAVSTVARFSTNLGIAHWEAVKHIFRYLKGMRDLWLTYEGTERKLVGYADADGSMAEDRKAVSGEYVAATHAAKEALWLHSLISEILSPATTSTVLFSDNQSAIALTQDHQYHARSKHIDIRYHFIRWVVKNGALRLIYCPTEDMVADTLTKALPSVKVKHFAAELGLS
ncbi:hypothetical protein EW146_g8993 [Bondarzewia mesenterica]|uniref:Integrase catalytic domain-containing protein n=1 Tax=Bondarzewia mesenterica TaxID=1095465 RepID=A0A4S4L9R3_9AGAM|nr:hypothetical protein EW146_g8993 [Bondarzewia mesenterica]